MNPTRVIFLFPAFLAFCVLSTAASAQVGGGPQGAIAYGGFLEKDGAPMNGTRTFRFGLFDAPADGNLIGSEFTLVDVPIHSGRFSVTLTPFPRGAFSQGPVYLEVTVIDGAEEVTLDGRQQILPAPYALGTTFGNDFSVSGHLGVGGADLDASSAAVLVGSGEDGQSPGQIGQLVPESTLEFPIGDEAAGGLSLYDKQDANQVASITYDTDAPELRLLNKGLGIRVDGFGNATVDGTLRWKCPDNMTRLGTWCIDNTAGRGSFDTASDRCHVRYAVVCSLDVLLLCDTLQPSTSTCTQETDGAANTDKIVTSGYSYTSYVDSVWQGIASFNGDDNTVDRVASTDVHNYFCCIPGYFFP
ncbi:MAG TPA: hypothetical protein VM425_12400 [Myxococcota bacterium]|nr:hypothetical protein [Myxococcota bacterium]